MCTGRFCLQVTQAPKGAALGPRGCVRPCLPSLVLSPTLCFLFVLCLQWHLRILIILKERTRGDLLFPPPITYMLIALKFADLVGLGTAVNPKKNNPPLFMYSLLPQERRQAACRSHSLPTSVTGKDRACLN